MQVLDARLWSARGWSKVRTTRTPWTVGEVVGTTDDGILHLYWPEVSSISTRLPSNERLLGGAHHSMSMRRWLEVHCTERYRNQGQ